METKNTMETTAQINLPISNYKNLLVTPTTQQLINGILNNGNPVTYNLNSKEFVMVHIDSNELSEFGDNNAQFHEKNHMETIGCQFCQLRNSCESQRGCKSPEIATICETQWGVLENHNNFQYEELYQPIFIEIQTIM